MLQSSGNTDKFTEFIWDPAARIK